MDNLAHTLCGAALARARITRHAPGVTLALLLGANLPDIDAWYYVIGDGVGAFEHRRGWTHSLLAFAFEIPLLASLVWLGVRRRRVPGHFRALLAASGLGILSHLGLDLLNTYGVRFLMPFSERWFYGDMVFIVDPWMWLFFAAAVFPARRWFGLAGWAALTGLGVTLMLSRHLPHAWIATWVTAVVVTVVAIGRREPVRLARLGLAVCAAYLLASKFASWTAESRARAYLVDSRVQADEIGEVVMNPGAARPWKWTAVVALPDEALRIALEAGPGFTWGEPAIVHRLERNLDDPALAAVEGTREWRVWRKFARIPFVFRDGDQLVLSDARYSRGAAVSWSNFYVPLAPSSSVPAGTD